MGIPDTPEGLIENLQGQALESAAEIGCPAEDTLEWEAAEAIARYAEALEAIARGAPEPTEIAKRALNPALYEALRRYAATSGSTGSG